MALTEFGVNHPMAVRLWAKRAMAETFAETWINRFVGDNQNSIIERKMPGNKGAGDRITFALRARLKGLGVRGDRTLEGNEEKLSYNTDTLIIDQLRNAVRSKGHMSEERVPFNIRADAKDSLVDWWANRMDTAAFIQLSGSPVVENEEVPGTFSIASLEETGMNPVFQPSANRMVLANPAAANESALTSSDTFTLGMIDRAVAKAKTTRPLMRPVRLGGEEVFVVVLHPYQVAQLRADNSAGSWKDIQMATLAGGDIKRNPLMTGAVGYYNGCIIHESNNIPVASTAAGVILPNVRRAVLLGAQAGVIGFWSDTPSADVEASFRWKEKYFDYDNELGVSLGGIFGLKKTRYMDADIETGAINTASGVDFATITLSSYSPTVA